MTHYGRDGDYISVQRGGKNPSQALNKAASEPSLLKKVTLVGASLVAAAALAVGSIKVLGDAMDREIDAEKQGMEQFHKNPSSTQHYIP